MSEVSFFWPHLIHEDHFWPDRYANMDNRWVYLDQAGSCQLLADNAAGYLLTSKGNKLDVFFVCCTVSLADYCGCDPHRCPFVCAFSTFVSSTSISTHQSDLNYLSGRALADAVWLPCVWLCAQSQHSVRPVTRTCLPRPGLASRA